MKLKDLLEKYGEYEVDLKKVVGKTEIESVTIDLTKPRPKSVWEMENDDEYYYINASGYVNWSCYAEIESEEEKVSVGNVFLTKEDALKDVERRKVETLLLKHGGRRWFRMGSICNYYMWVNTSDSLVVGCTGVGMQGLIYFDTREKAEKAIDEIGADRIKEALFEVR